jgi:hypothetical protein
MNRESVEKKILNVLRTVGWINFVCFAALFVTMKATSEEHYFWAKFTGIVCIAGTLVYYGFWQWLFLTVSRKDGLKFFTPYRLGAFVFIGGVLFLSLMRWFS